MRGKSSVNVILPSQQFPAMRGEMSVHRVNCRWKLVQLAAHRVLAVHGPAEQQSLLSYIKPNFGTV